MFVWDTGQQRSGWATVSVSGAPAGTPIQIRYAEKLGTDGKVSITGYAPGGQIQTDYYIAKGPDAQTFTPRFTYKGFQYVQTQRGRRRSAARRHHRDRRLRAGDPRADGADRRVRHLERPGDLI